MINLPGEQQIILIESSPPIKTRKIFYYKDPFFTKRLLPMTHVPQQEPYDPEKVGKRKVKDGEDNSKDNEKSESKPSEGESAAAG